MKSKVVNIATGEPVFEEWLGKVMNNNKEIKSTDKAVLFWQKNDSQANWAYLNMEVDDLVQLHHELGEIVFNWKVDDYLKKHIGEYIEYIEE